MSAADVAGEVRKCKCNDGCHDPMGKTPQGLTLCANLCRKDLGNEYPDTAP